MISLRQQPFLTDADSNSGGGRCVRTIGARRRIRYVQDEGGNENYRGSNIEVKAGADHLPGLAPALAAKR